MRAAVSALVALLPTRWRPHVVRLRRAVHATRARRRGPTVVRVIDGDTVVVRIGGADEPVRLIGIDTPETKHPTKPVQCFGPEASDVHRPAAAAGHRRCGSSATSRPATVTGACWPTCTGPTTLFVNLELARRATPTAAHRAQQRPRARRRRRRRRGPAPAARAVGRLLAGPVPGAPTPTASGRQPVASRAVTSLAERLGYGPTTAC